MSELTQRRGEGQQIKLLADRSITMLKDHVGIENAISKEDFFKKIFNHPLDLNDLTDWVRWEILKKSLNYLRRKSNCFVIQHNHKIFVVSKNEEAKLYVQNLNRTINNIVKLQNRCVQSVEEQWFKEDFTLTKIMSPSIDNPRKNLTLKELF